MADGVDRSVAPGTPATATTPEGGVPAGAGEGGAATGGERPEWLPEKFKTPADMAAAYAALEQKLGSGEGGSGEGDGTTGGEAGKADDTTKSSDPVSYGKLVDGALESAGLSAKGVWDEFQQSGGLSPDTYKALEGQGFTKELVDTYMQGFKATAGDGGEAEADTVLESVTAELGGPEVLENMKAWASANLSEADLKMYNDLVNDSKPETVRMAALTLKGWFEAATGSEPKLLRGGTKPGSDVFKSAQELATAMTEARATGDPAKIRAVEQKALRSNVFGR